MTMLKDVWSRIQPRVSDGVDGYNVVAESFLYPWNHDSANMDMIVQAIEIYKPKTVIELGTFEGWGTEKIAIAMRKNGGGRLFTFDAGKAPLTMGLPYGVTEEYLVDGCLVDWENIPFEGWKSFGKVIEKRKERWKRLRKIVPNIRIKFIEGMTWDTLPIWLPKIGTWDFLFQDASHDIDNIIREWKIYSSYSKEGSLIVFDDVYEDGGVPNKGDVVKYFRENETDWEWIHTNIGHHQLWGERRI